MEKKYRYLMYAITIAIVVGIMCYEPTSKFLDELDLSSFRTIWFIQATVSFGVLFFLFLTTLDKVERRFGRPTAWLFIITTLTSLFTIVTYLYTTSVGLIPIIETLVFIGVIVFFCGTLINKL